MSARYKEYKDGTLIPVDRTEFPSFFATSAYQRDLRFKAVMDGYAADRGDVKRAVYRPERIVLSSRSFLGNMHAKFGGA